MMPSLWRLWKHAVDYIIVLVCVGFLLELWLPLPSKTCITHLSPISVAFSLYQALTCKHKLEHTHTNTHSVTQWYQHVCLPLFLPGCVLEESWCPKPLSMAVCSTSQQADGGNGCEAHPLNHTGESDKRDDTGRMHVNVQVCTTVEEFSRRG